MDARLRFFGGVETVTGSKALVETSSGRTLVDCGLFQGVKALRRRNWAPSPVDPKSLDAVILTHAHLDHSGLVPVLVRSGFEGPIYCSSGTASLLGLLWPDAAYLQTEDAKHRNRTGTTRHRPARPLFEPADAVRALRRLHVVPFGEPFEPVEGLSASLTRAGHILGASSVRLEHQGRSVVFSGDLGRREDPVMRPPAARPDSDLVVVESTYGDRLHGGPAPEDELADIVCRTIGRGGTLLIPAFAVGRAQGVLHLLARLRAAGRIPDVPTYLNSPMAIRATGLYCAHMDDHRLTEDQCAAMCSAEMTRSPSESKALNRDPRPKIILSASGMATGGRILHHLEAFASDPRTTLLFVGYQAAGTRGRALVRGADRVKVHGRYVQVAAEVAQMSSLSAHADKAELLAWLASAPNPPSEILINHGEPSASDAFRASVEEELGWPARCLTHGEVVELTPARGTAA